MVAPYRHVESVENLTEEEAKEMMKILCQMVNLLKEVMRPEGLNVGMNLGKVAGAGVVDHVHLHIVPRWKGDSHFMSVLSDTRIISEALKETYNQLKGKLSKD
jgi:ATP adenylyltransferase